MHNSWLLWWVGAVVAMAILGMVLFRLSPAARLRRRRRKNNSRVISKARQPSVRFSVNTRKNDE
jgi:hypothetical protein